MEVDAEQLLFAVEQRAAIYSPNLKDHSNKTIVDKLWQEVSDELKRPGKFNIYLFSFVICS